MRLPHRDGDFTGCCRRTNGFAVAPVMLYAIGPVFWGAGLALCQ